jgi:hypothetical protein
MVIGRRGSVDIYLNRTNKLICRICCGEQNTTISYRAGTRNMHIKERNAKNSLLCVTWGGITLRSLALLSTEGILDTTYENNIINLLHLKIKRT